MFNHFSFLIEVLGDKPKIIKVFILIISYDMRLLGILF